MIDIHTHILPNVDDGASSIDISLELLQQEIKEGVREVILTPHQNKKNLKKDKLIEAYKEFLDKTKDLPIKISLGSEIYYYPGMKEDLKNNAILTMKNSSTILVEFSTSTKIDIAEAVYELYIAGYKVIVAHIERYSYLDKDDYKEIHKYAKIQVNAQSIERKEYKKIIKHLVKNNLIDFVASDCHDTNRRKVDFTKIKKYISKKNKELYDKLFSIDSIEF